MNILHAIDGSTEEKEKTFSYCAMGWLERWFRFKGVIDNLRCTDTGYRYGDTDTAIP
jgi:hypothetical protein